VDDNKVNVVGEFASSFWQGACVFLLYIFIFPSKMLVGVRVSVFLSFIYCAITYRFDHFFYR
jgi:hypothetical protein